MIDDITVAIPRQSPEVEVSGEENLKSSILSTEEVDPPQNAKYEESPLEFSEGEFWMWEGKENEGWKVEALKLASEVSGNNLNFIRKITGENGGMDHTLQSRVVKNGIREDSWGYCQIHRQWHSAIVDDPRFFTDKRWQMENCFRLWSGGTKFYAPKTPANQFYLTNEL